MELPSWNPDQLERNRFVRFRTLYTLDRLVDLARDKPYRILDFGCGEGHSVGPMLDFFPNAQVVGADISGGALSTFVAHFGDNPRVTVVPMDDPVVLDRIDGPFDIIHMNAVFEHLLPDERKRVMPDLWRRLAMNGYLIVTETPWRWFPIETHTTSLPLVNYLPDRLALMAARYRHGKSMTWDEALRGGVRGGTVDEIVSSLGAARGSVRQVRSLKPDARDLLEIWWHGECRRTRPKAFAYQTLAWLRRLTGVVVSPWINIVLQKVA